jgi:tRNA threonylcarbamoyl adenosine modification protein YeaZ
VLLLALDTSTPVVSVAVARSNLPDEPGVYGLAGPATTCLAERAAEANNRHGEVLAALIAETLAAAGAGPGDLGRICVGVGPAPYTGLRVGVVTALTFGDALGVAVTGVCSLDVIAHWDERPWPDGFTVVTDARRREVFWASYKDGRRISGPDVHPPAEVAGRLPAGSTVVGAGAVLHAPSFEGNFVDPRQPTPRAADLAEIATDARWVIRPPSPIYLRRPDARPPGAPKRVTPA